MDIAVFAKSVFKPSVISLRVRKYVLIFVSHFPVFQPEGLFPGFRPERVLNVAIRREVNMAKAKSKVEINNKRASFEYEFIEGFTAGIVLTGTEIKSIRMGKASLVDSYCYFSGNELYVKNMHVADYWWGSWGKHDPRRDRKLLLNRSELRKLQRAVKEKGMTIVATRLFISDKGYAKLHIELARGKREYDKRQAIKEKDMKRAMSME